MAAPLGEAAQKEFRSAPFPIRLQGVCQESWIWPQVLRATTRASASIGGSVS